MTALHRLQDALIEWRAAERVWATRVLSSALPIYIAEARDAELQALAKVRAIVDSEPWSDIQQGL